MLSLQVEASTAMLNEQTSTRELTISKLEIRISDLESQLVAQTEEEKMKLERLVKETGEVATLSQPPPCIPACHVWHAAAI